MIQRKVANPRGGYQSIVWLILPEKCPKFKKGSGKGSRKSTNALLDGSGDVSQILHFLGSFYSMTCFSTRTICSIIYYPSEIKIPMTAPVTVRIEPGAGPNCESTFIISFFIGQNFRQTPPKPTNPDVYLATVPEMDVYAR